MPDLTPLVEFLFQSVIDETEALNIQVIEGDSAIIFEVALGDSDRARLLEKDGSLLRSMQTILSVAAKKNKAILDLISIDEIDDEE